MSGTRVPLIVLHPVAQIRERILDGYADALRPAGARSATLRRRVSYVGRKGRSAARRLRAYSPGTDAFEVAHALALERVERRVAEMVGAASPWQ